MIDSVCDYCGNYKVNCSQYRGCMVCAECQAEHRQALSVLKRAASASLLKRMEARTV